MHSLPTPGTNGKVSNETRYFELWLWSSHIIRDFILAYAEPDCFFCFTNLMSDIRDFFIKTLDESSTGINGMMKRLMNRVQALDRKVYEQLEEQGIKPQYFSFRYEIIRIKFFPGLVIAAQAIYRMRS